MNYRYFLNAVCFECVYQRWLARFGGYESDHPRDVWWNEIFEGKVSE